MGKILFVVVATILVAFVLVNIFSKTKNQNSNQEIITQDDIVETTITAQDAEEFKITTLVEGEGQETKDGDTLVVHYTGKLLDGTVFDSSLDRDEPFEFTLGAGGVIQGWEEGMQGMKVGEKRILTIPSSMGYGETGSGERIPPGAGLEFEVELLEIKEA
jgi:FKBP-type peptidyl-prolyl cis-trans isomerase